MGLFNLFRTKAECPVDEETREWVDVRWAWLESQFGAARVRNSRVVLAKPGFFPDPYNGTEEDARRIFDRVCGYMAIDPKSIDMSLYTVALPVEGLPHLGVRAQDTAGFYQRVDGRDQIWIEAENLEDPLAMVATMAHELGHVHLLSQGRISPEEEDHEPLTDLLTVFFGMGVITANSVIREENLRMGNYSSWKIGRRGYLTMPVFGYALAHFAMLRGDDGAAWSRELRPDVRSAFKRGLAFLTRVIDA
jgi:hypothetical protein